MGPIAYTPEESMGCIISMDVTMAAVSGDATLALLTADTFEAISSSAAAYTGTVTAGLNATISPSGRGVAFSIKLTNVANTGFVYEDTRVVTRHAGTRRIS